METLKNFLYSGLMKRSSSNVQKLFILFQKKNFSYISEIPKNVFYIFLKKSCSYISENRTPFKKNFYLSGKGTFLYFISGGSSEAPKNQKKLWINFSKKHFRINLFFIRLAGRRKNSLKFLWICLTTFSSIYLHSFEKTWG